MTPLGEKFVKTGKMDPETHQWLREAFDQRLVGDYEWEASLSPETLGELLSHARQFMDQTVVYLSAPPHPGTADPPFAHEPRTIYRAGPLKKPGARRTQGKRGTSRKPRRKG